MPFHRIALAAALALQLSAAMAATPLSSGVDRSAIDTSVRAQDDLFKAANGAWLKSTAIPADKSDWGVTRELRDLSDKRVRAIVEQMAQGQHAPGSVEQKVGDFYASYLDEAAIDAAGFKPLQGWFERIDALKTPHDAAKLMGELQGVGKTPIALWAEADAKNPTIYRALTWQSGLGLPDRDYYLKHDERFSKARAAYQRYLETLFRLSGDAAPAQSAKAVLAFEQKLAQAQWASADNRDPQRLYNPMTPVQLAKKAPGFDWAAFFDGAGMPAMDKISVSQPSFAVAMAKAMHATPMPVLQKYLRVHLIDEFSEVLPKDVRDASFELHGKVLRGLQQPLPRWQQATTAIDGALGEAVGQIYVQRHFPPEYKARMQALVGKLMEAYAQSIDGLTWMSPETKQRAKTKLSKYTVKIGYPEVWRDYSKLMVKPHDALGNAERAGRFEFERVAHRAGQPVDRSEWGMTPQTVNAYYNPSFNEIVFPAAYLQPPNFDPNADDAANYGAIGATIGHEISHGFDDSGSQFDGDGKLANWWTPADRKAFESLTAKLAAQFDAYEPIPGHHVNGKLSLGENIADLAGLEIAYKAWRLSLNGQPSPVIDGMTGDERFFLAYAQSWREKMRDERTLQLLVSDPHAPADTRTNGPVANIDAFHQSFHTKPGDGMWKAPQQRIHIW